MSHHNHSVFPHPVLSPRRRDYASNCNFKILVTSPVLNREGIFSLTIKYCVDCPSLQQQVEDQRAACLALLECSATYRREEHTVKGFDDVLQLDSREWSDRVLLTPYITATKSIPGFWSEEFSPVTKTLISGGLDLQVGTVLAVGETTEIEVTSEGNSIFDLASNLRAPPGTFQINLDGERIAITLNRDDLQKINELRKIRRHQPLLNQALYLHALYEALRSWPDFADKRWAKTLLRKMEEQGIDFQDGDFADRVQFYAQKLFEYPLSAMLDSIHREDSK